eukprot:m.1386923 g.1386923  ORF g.1386923 m.1386923 type:complete len:1517 (+) comp24978_c1_seq6:332-4882(+)
MDRQRSNSVIASRAQSNREIATEPPPPPYSVHTHPNQRSLSGNPRVSVSGQSRLSHAQTSLPQMAQQGANQPHGIHGGGQQQRASAISRSRHSIGVNPRMTDRTSTPTMSLQQPFHSHQQQPREHATRPALVTYDPTDPFAVKQGEPRERVKSTLFKMQIHRADLKAIKVVGEGQYGQVYLAKQTIPSATGPSRVITRAVKTLRNGVTPEGKAEFVHEAEMMLDLVHPNVVRLIGVALQQRPWLSVLEFCVHGDLQDILRKCFLRKKKRGRWRFVEQLHIAQQVALGMEYIGQHNRLHIDLAARNVLVTTHNIAKVTDFGLGQQLPSDGPEIFTLRRAMQLPIPWLAQESLLHKQFSTKTDVWSYGVFVWEIFSYARNPYVDEGIAVREIKNVVAEGSRLNCPKDCDPEFFQDVVLPCWNPNPVMRPDFGMLYSQLNARFEQERMRALNRGEGVCIGQEGNPHLSPIRDIACVALGTTPVLGVSHDAAQTQLLAVRAAQERRAPAPGHAGPRPPPDNVARRARSSTFASPPTLNPPVRASVGPPAGRPNTAATQKQQELRAQRQRLLQQEQQERQASVPRIREQSTPTRPQPATPPRKAQTIFSPLDVECKVMVYGHGMGVIRYVGPVGGDPLTNDVDVVGVELLGESGDHDGNLDGKQYFTCAPNHGVFCDQLDVFRCDKNFIPLIDLSRLNFGEFDFSDIGAAVTVSGYGIGNIRFLGLHQHDGRERVGVELVDAVGKNDGMVRGHRYFSCEPKHGVLVAVDKVSLADAVAPITRERVRMHEDTMETPAQELPSGFAPSSKLASGAVDSDEVKNNPFFAFLDDDTDELPPSQAPAGDQNGRANSGGSFPPQQRTSNDSDGNPNETPEGDDIFARLTEMFPHHAHNKLLSIAKSVSTIDHAVELVIEDENTSSNPDPSDVATAATSVAPALVSPQPRAHTGQRSTGQLRVEQIQTRQPLPGQPYTGRTQPENASAQHPHTAQPIHGQLHTGQAQTGQFHASQSQTEQSHTGKTHAAQSHGAAHGGPERETATPESLSGFPSSRTPPMQPPDVPGATDAKQGANAPAGAPPPRTVHMLPPVTLPIGPRMQEAGGASPPRPARRTTQSTALSPPTAAPTPSVKPRSNPARRSAPDYSVPNEILASPRPIANTGTANEVYHVADPEDSVGDEDDIQGFDDEPLDQEPTLNASTEHNTIESNVTAGDTRKKKPRWVRVLHKVQKGPNRWRKGKKNSTDNHKIVHPHDEAAGNPVVQDNVPNRQGSRTETVVNIAPSKRVLSLQSPSHIDSSTTDAGGDDIDATAESTTTTAGHVVSSSTADRAPPSILQTKPCAQSSRPALPPRLERDANALRSDIAQDTYSTSGSKDVPLELQVDVANEQPSPNLNGVTDPYQQPIEATNFTINRENAGPMINSAQENSMCSISEQAEPQESYLDESDCQDVAYDDEDYPDLVVEKSAPKQAASGMDTDIASLLDVATDIGGPPAGPPPRIDSCGSTSSGSCSDEMLHLGPSHSSSTL